MAAQPGKSKTRAESPAGGRVSTPADKDKAAADAAGAAKEKFKPPPRPRDLRGQILKLYALVVATIGFFALVGESMKHPIPEGKFKKKDGTLIALSEFDPVELGPFPKCHERHGKHYNGSDWVKNDVVSSKGPFPAGHPENEVWMAKWDQEAKKENREKRFTWEGLQPNLHLLSLATLCVLIGSKHGVWMFTETDAEITKGQDGPQMMQKEDAMWFPIMGSCVLFGLFCIYKYLGSEFVKTLFSCFIVCMCAVGVGTNIGHLTGLVTGKALSPLFRIPIVDKSINKAEILGYLLGASLAAGFISTKHWIINNLFGVSFCMVGIKMIGLSNYKTGAIMLIGLFFYDVFWVFGSKSVFGSNVMVTVAKGVEGPIKLMFPRSLSGCGDLQHSMLGLGDIVVPGLFIAFLAKFDAVKMGEKKSHSFVYLNSAMVAYVLSLATTVGIMLFFNAAQPALLYIVPYVLIASVMVAVSRGELKDLLAYEIPEDGEDTNDGEAKEKQKKEE